VPTLASLEVHAGRKLSEQFVAIGGWKVGFMVNGIRRELVFRFC